MSFRPRAEALALVLSLVLLAGFLVSAASGIRFDSSGPDVSATSDVRPAASPANAAPPSVDGPATRVEVLNGSGRPGLARSATERLRAAGFDVVYFGNAGEPRGLSLVLDRGGADAGARRAAAALGIRDVRTEPNAVRMVDVTVMLGKDWPPKADTARVQPRGLRRWLRSIF